MQRIDNSHLYDASRAAFPELAIGDATPFGGLYGGASTFLRFYEVRRTIRIRAILARHRFIKTAYRSFVESDGSR